MIIQGNCFDLIKKQPDNSVDLIITSPPYADIVNYGKSVSHLEKRIKRKKLILFGNEINY